MPVLWVVALGGGCSQEVGGKNDALTPDPHSATYLIFIRDLQSALDNNVLDFAALRGCPTGIDRAKSGSLWITNYNDVVMSEVWRKIKEEHQSPEPRGAKRSGLASSCSGLGN